MSENVTRLIIWQPKYSTRSVLLAKHKVGKYNEIVFTKAPAYPHKYFMKGEDIKKYPLRSNGSCLCYDVKLDDLEIID